MLTSFTSRSGLSLARTPSHRQQTMRRRIAIAIAVAALALASGLLGSLVRPAHAPLPALAVTGPFSYFPS